MQKYDAVILAGGRYEWLKGLAGTDITCFAELGGKIILQRLADALTGSGRVNRIVLALPEDVLHLNADKFLTADFTVCPAGDSLPDTAMTAVAALGAKRNEKILFICDDIPMLTTEAVTDFLQQCESLPDGEIFYPVVSKEVCLNTYPTASRTFAPLSDGRYTGGNMVLVTAKAVADARKKAREIYARRKDPWKLCAWLGWKIALKAIFGKLTAQEVAKCCTEIFNLQCHAVISTYPEIAMDIDKPADWKLLHSYAEKEGHLL